MVNVQKMPGCLVMMLIQKTKIKKINVHAFGNEFLMQIKNKSNEP